MYLFLQHSYNYRFDGMLCMKKKTEVFSSTILWIIKETSDFIKETGDFIKETSDFIKDW